jgi:VIT1/CCC1 family predicted Fe2+/Mn2+ transporter
VFFFRMTSFSSSSSSSSRLSKRSSESLETSIDPRRQSLSEDSSKVVLEPKVLKARNAFLEKDAEASRALHDFYASSKEFHQGEAGEYVQSVVFGGLDGIITTFAVVSASVASGLSYGLILIIGFANLIGDAVGMGVGDYLSSKAENDREQAERNREAWELEHMPDSEKEEMIDIYTSKGISQEDAVQVVELLYRSSKSAFLDVMLAEELGIMPKEQEISALKSGIVTFSAFVFFGGLPMLPYLFSGKYTHVGKFDFVFGISIALFCISLYSLGAFKGKITGKKWYLSGIAMLANGVITTTIAYFIGFALEQS